MTTNMTIRKTILPRFSIELWIQPFRCHHIDSYYQQPASSSGYQEGLKNEIHIVEEQTLNTTQCCTPHPLIRVMSSIVAGSAIPGIDF